jgi:hypothetical protein
MFRCINESESHSRKVMGLYLEKYCTQNPIAIANEKLLGLNERKRPGIGIPT